MHIVLNEIERYIQKVPNPFILRSEEISHTDTK